MSALVLVFVACLGQDPKSCRPIEVPWDGTLQQCVAMGQTAMAAWLNEHPGWRLVGGIYSCGTPRGRAA